jgi:hypothetical protein
MEPLIISEGESTPKIILDKEKNKFEISGISLPEDVFEFYAPVFKWIEEYVKKPNQKTELIIKFNYFNTSSSKIILEILNKLDELKKKGFDVTISWYYLEMDEDMLSTGKEFESMLTIPFTFLTYMQA